MLSRIALQTAVTLAAAAFIHLQAAAEFETATVKLNTADDHIVTINVGAGGRFDCRGYTLGLLIQRAYGVMDWNIDGGPGWIRTDRYDVSAKANMDGMLTEAQLQTHLQALLAEHFKLKVHRSLKETSGYALVVSPGGAKVKTAADGEEHPDTFRMGGAGLSGQGIKMEDLARFVGGKLGFVAVDETGLTGLYDLKVDWNVELADDSRAALRSAVFAALKNQLGLELIAKKVTLRMIVVDHAERVASM